MHYVSEMPVVVGEFDADALHAQIDTFEADQAFDGSKKSMTSLLRGETSDIAETLDIEWDGVNPDDYEALFVNTLQYFMPGVKMIEEVDHWHPDLLKVYHYNFWQIAETISGASRWPTKYLVGNVAVGSLDVLRIGPAKYWRHEASEAACRDAIERGDARPIEFEPGEIVRARGTIHRRNIPYGAEGYRYYFRKYNKGRTHPLKDRLVAQLRLK